VGHGDHKPEWRTGRELRRADHGERAAGQLTVRPECTHIYRGQSWLWPGCDARLTLQIQVETRTKVVHRAALDRSRLRSRRQLPRTLTAIRTCYVSAGLRHV
jgi:hypothetical protein